MAAAGAAAAARSGSAARAGTAAKNTPAKGKGSSGAGRADRSGPATKSDIARLRSEAAARDDLAQGAYEAGIDGTAWEDLAQEVRDAPGGREAYESGLEERSQGRRSAAVSGARGAASSLGSGASNVAGFKGPGWANDGAGFVLGLIVYALALNYLQGGPAQVRGWLRAKFLNQPYGAGGGASGRVSAAAKAAAEAAKRGAERGEG